MGRYELSPGVVLTFSREGDRYFAQLSNQEKFEVFPSSPADFFYKAVDAQLTFTKDAQGKGSSLILHQHGDYVARRLP